MNDLRERLVEKISKKQKILSIYLTAGFPEADSTVSLLRAIAENGADLIELGVPFSDPQADGPVIQQASQKALDAGMRVAKVFSILQEFRCFSTVPVILMGYANPFMKYGWRRCAEEAAAAGANGFIIPDLPPEESGDLTRLCRTNGLDQIYLITPVTPVTRIELINSLTSGFIYAVSITGVTGERRELPLETIQFLRRLRKTSRHPVLVGFGVSNQETAKSLAAESDGVIIGSAIIRLIAESKNTGEACEKVKAFVWMIKDSLGEIA